MLFERERDGTLKIWTGISELRELDRRQWVDEDMDGPRELFVAPSLTLTRQESLEVVFQVLRGPEGPTGAVGPAGRPITPS